MTVGSTSVKVKVKNVEEKDDGFVFCWYNKITVFQYVRMRKSLLVGYRLKLHRLKLERGLYT